MTALNPAAPRKRSRLRLGAVSVGSMLGSTGTMFVLSLITARIVEAQGIGRYALAATPTMVATMISSLGEMRLVLRTSAEYDHSQAFWAVLATSFRVTSKVVTLAAVGGAVVYLQFLKDPGLFVMSIVMLLGYLFIDNTIAALDGMLMVKERAETVALLRIMSPVVHGAVVLLAAIVLRRSVWILIVAQLVGNGLIATYKAWQVRATIFPVLRKHQRVDATEFIRKTQRILVLSNAGASLVRSFPNFILKTNAVPAVGLATVGSFQRADSMASRLSTVASFFELSNFNSVLEKRKDSDLFIKSFRVLESVALPLLLLGSAGGLALVYVMPIYGTTFEVDSVRFMSYLGLHYAIECIGVGVNSAAWAAYPVERLTKVLALGCIPAFLVAVAWWFLRFEPVFAAIGVMSGLTSSHLAIGLLASLRKVPRHARRWALGCIARLVITVVCCVAILAWCAFRATRFQTALAGAGMLGLTVGQTLPAFLAHRKTKPTEGS